VTPCSLEVVTSVSEEPDASIFKGENVGRRNLLIFESGYVLFKCPVNMKVAKLKTKKKGCTLHDDDGAIK
jgi:hypothetical protein